MVHFLKTTIATVVQLIVRLHHVTKALEHVHVNQDTLDHNALKVYIHDNLCYNNNIKYICSVKIIIIHKG